jgi:hypothetical protein
VKRAKKVKGKKGRDFFYHLFEEGVRERLRSRYE